MNVMVDTETMSTKSNAAVASLGAVMFTTDVVESHRNVVGQRGLTYPWPDALCGDLDLKRANHEPVDDALRQCRWFYANLDLRQQRDRDFDPDTLYWWLQQSDSARGALVINVAPVIEALQMFIQWYRAHQPAYAWSFGANFDHPILESLFWNKGLKYPPSFREQLCARTIINVTKAEPPPKEGTLHSALSDAINQAIWMQKARERLMKGGNG